jgi:hypothetical protein
MEGQINELIVGNEYSSYDLQYYLSIDHQAIIETKKGIYLFSAMFSNCKFVIKNKREITQNRFLDNVITTQDFTIYEAEIINS